MSIGDIMYFKVFGEEEGQKMAVSMFGLLVIGGGALVVAAAVTIIVVVLKNNKHD